MSLVKKILISCPITVGKGNFCLSFPRKLVMTAHRCHPNTLKTGGSELPASLGYKAYHRCQPELAMPPKPKQTKTKVRVGGVTLVECSPSTPKALSDAQHQESKAKQPNGKTNGNFMCLITQKYWFPHKHPNSIMKH